MPHPLSQRLAAAVAALADLTPLCEARDASDPNYTDVKLAETKPGVNIAALMREIVKAFPPDSKKGRYPDVTLLLTGNVAAALNKPNYTKIQLSDLSNADLKVLHAAVTSKPKQR